MSRTKSQYIRLDSSQHQLDLFRSKLPEPEKTNSPNTFTEIQPPAKDPKNMAALYELSIQAYFAAINAQMDDTLNKNYIDQYVQKVLNAAADAINSQPAVPGTSTAQTAQTQLAARAAADKAANDRGDPLVRIILESAQRVGHEIHRLMGLLRFNPGKDGIWVARCTPDNSVLPVLAEHFTLRFGEVPWAIIDEKRSNALVRLSGEAPRYGPLASFPFLLSCEVPKDQWEDLWRCYHHSINIENRKNPVLQVQLMPRRYWKYLPEVN